VKKAIVASVLAMLLLAVAAPALAQGRGAAPEPMRATAGGGRPGSSGGSMPDYEFDQKDGSVYIGGDIRMSCPDFVATLDEERDPSGRIPSRARSVVDQCEEAGLLSPGAPSASSNASAGGAEEELPDSGGPPLPTLLGLTSILLVTAALLARKVAG
jgi:hypothetical protein